MYTNKFFLDKLKKYKKYENLLILRNHYKNKKCNGNDIVDRSPLDFIIPLTFATNNVR